MVSATAASTRRRAFPARWIAGVVAVLVLALCVALYLRSRRPPPVSYEAQAADRGDIVARVTATGTLSPLVSVPVGAQVSGRIVAIYADFNSRVQKGEVIAKIDPQLFQSAVEQARANDVAAEGALARAKAEALDAERQYQRSKGLAAKDLVAPASMDTAEATLEEARASVQSAEGTLEQAQASLHQAQVNLAYTTIYSPTDGVVIARNVDVGQTVQASLQAPTLFTIAQDLAHMQVDTNVTEADVGRLWAGMNATFTVDAYPSETFAGTVRQVRYNPTTVQNVVTYDAVIDVANPDLRLRPGMTANVAFVYADEHQVLRVPNPALRFHPAGVVPPAANQEGMRRPAAGSQPIGMAGKPAPRRRTVWVLRGGQPVPVEIHTGVSDGTYTEIVSGDLHDGDPVVVRASGGGPSQGGGGTPFHRMF